LNSIDFESAVARALRDCPAETVFLAAVSGGADSTAMLAALVSLREAGGFSLRCLHVEHGIRPAAESQGDAAFVRERCGAFGVPCAVVSIGQGKIAARARASGLGLEAAARLYRRRALFREARRLAAGGGGPVRIVTAHTADDALETALMRILRGAGPAGLAAMPVSRGPFLRPLLALSRSDVLDYLAARRIPWREDSTNADIRFLRNRVRRRLIPFLNEWFPQWRTGLAAVTETQALAAAFIAGEARRRLPLSPEDGSLSASAEDFFAQSAIIREEALFQGIDRLLAGKGAVPVKRAGLRRFCAGELKAADLGPVRVRREAARVLVSTRQPPISERGFALLIKAPGLYTLKGVRVRVRRCQEGTAGENAGDGSFALLPLVLRRSFKGDRISPAGGTMRNGSRCFSVLDQGGVAALIGPDAVIRRRGIPAAAREDAGRLCVITVLNNRADTSKNHGF
jgi:tRNA(Ile)-lysidine synthase